MSEIDLYLAAARQHPYLAALVVVHLALSALGNLHLTEATARAWPRLAMAVLLGQCVGLVVRGVTKPLLGLVLPSAAKDVLEQLYPGAVNSVPPTPGGPS